MADLGKLERRISNWISRLEGVKYTATSRTSLTRPRAMSWAESNAKILGDNGQVQWEEERTSDGDDARCA